MGNIRNVNPQLEIAATALNAEGIVEILGRLPVNGHRREMGQVPPPGIMGKVCR